MLISSKTLLETKHAKNVFVINGDERSKFIFIISPGLRAENIPKYKIVQSPEKQIFFPISITKCEDILREAVREKISIEGYLTGYKREKTTKYKLKNPNPKPRVKKMPKLAIVDEEDELEAAVQKEVLGQVAAEEVEEVEVEAEKEAEEPEKVEVEKLEEPEQNINSDSSLKSRKNVTRVVIKKTKRRRKPGPVKLVIEE